MNLNQGDLFFAKLPAKLAMAEELHAGFGDRLLAAPAISGLRPLLERYARELQQQMVELDLPGKCRRCGTGPAGGCCSREMGDDADAVLLLANLLYGGQVHYRPGDDRECGFLGPQGCSLRLKPIFCLNYNCHGIRTSCSAAGFAALERATGRLLTTQTVLEQRILDCLARSF